MALIFSCDTAYLRVQRPEYPHPFSATRTHMFFNQLLIFTNLYQHVKNIGFVIILF